MQLSVIIKQMEQALNNNDEKELDRLKNQLDKHLK